MDQGYHALRWELLDEPPADPELRAELERLAGEAIFTGVPDPLPDIFNVEGDLKLIGIRFAGYMATITILYLLKRMVFRG